MQYILLWIRPLNSAFDLKVLKKKTMKSRILKQNQTKWKLHNLNFEVPTVPGTTISAPLGASPDGKIAANLRLEEPGTRGAILQFGSGD